ncbi:unnamed protein product, partial [Cuscuta epithymum]
MLLGLKYPFRILLQYLKLLQIMLQFKLLSTTTRKITLIEAEVVEILAEAVVVVVLVEEIRLFAKSVAKMDIMPLYVIIDMIQRILHLHQFLNTHSIQIHHPIHHHKDQLPTFLILLVQIILLHLHNLSTGTNNPLTLQNPAPYNNPLNAPTYIPAPYHTSSNPSPSVVWAYATPSVLGPAPQSQSWFPDSGATHHVTADPLNLQRSETLATTDKLFMGNGQGVDIKSIGSSIFPSPYHSSMHLSLNNILHVPTITKNLLSVSQFAKDNLVFFEFHPYDCFVKSQVSKQILLHGSLREDGLYKFQSIPLHSHPSV